MTMMVPMEVGLVAFAWEMRILHLSKTFLPLILPNIANAFGVFWMTQYMKDAFPYELIESGKIDGCNDMGVFIRLVLPHYPSGSLYPEHYFLSAILEQLSASYDHDK